MSGQEVMSRAGELFAGGLGNLAAYLAAHVLLCLLPAFLIAGAMSALIPKETITRFLGRTRSVFISYPAAAVAGFLLAVCSCTVIPLFAGIYKKGAGLGPAITFLFVAPAVNILAISYTGRVIGMDLAVARLILSIGFGVLIGLAMASIFRKDDLAHDEASDLLFAGEAKMGWTRGVFLLLLAALLIAGTLQVDILKVSYAHFDLPMPGVGAFQDFLHRLVPFDVTRGEEGVTVQGAILIGLLFLNGIAAWRGIGSANDGINRWSWIFMVILGSTLLFASLNIIPGRTILTIHFTGKFFAVLAAVVPLGFVLRKRLSRDDAEAFLWESWRFTKQIFPLLILGVFVVGIVRGLIQPEWIKALAGENSLRGNFAGVVFGIVMYFPTLIEVPVAQMFLELGMHRGPLLAYLIADPVLSFQSVLLTAAIIGRKKAVVYVLLIALAGTVAGLLYGTWVNSYQ